MSMPRNWGPRQIVFRRFLQVHDALEKAFGYVEDIITFHRDRSDSTDLTAYANDLKTLLAQVDKCVDMMEIRFRTGRWPEEVDHGSSQPTHSEGNQPPVP
jgi:hypothetical protein